MEKKSLSIRMGIMIVFIILMLTTVSIMGYIVFSNWLASSEETFVSMAEEMNTEIFHQVDAFINIPMHINEVNHMFIENGIVDIYNEKERESYFAGVLGSHTDDVYSFSYGTEKGEYYGARRNEKNEIEIMRNNALTGGNSWYYSVNEDMTAGELAVQAGKFDPRTRDWYKTAKEKQMPSFSPIYKHFVMEDLTVSAGYPIYGKDGELLGVLGTHITLSRINKFLEEIVKDKNAFAVIVEKESGELIANSTGIQNFKVLGDGSIRRLKLDDLDNSAVTIAYKEYMNKISSDPRKRSNGDRMYINLTEYHQEGLDWLVITAIPESLFTAGIMKSMTFTLLLVILALILSIAAYLKITNEYLKPIGSLIQATEKFSQGHLDYRVPVVRDDEFGRISRAFNKMATTVYELVNNLEDKVRERTAELEKSNDALKENKEQLRLILDSTAEAIYGMDNNGCCTFCNASCLKILGYSHQDELIGKNMHLMIHHSRRDGTPMPIDECKIYKAFLEGKGTHADDEVFWRSDGTCFDVEYYSYPQYKDGKIIGAVVTFMDNTERKQSEEHIRFLSYHDSLTGLYNRMCFEEQLKKIDTKKNLPISIIFGDVNGLKLTNDIFGHAAGDALIKKSAEILKRACREGDIVARVGGDEFIILLPRTEGADAQKIIARVKKELSKEHIAAIKCSMSMGYDTKTSEDQDIERTMENAENEMYKEKTLNRSTINSDMVETIINTLHDNSPREKQHSINVSEICQSIGQAMGLSETEVRKLKQAGFLHDIGKIVLEPDLLNKNELTEEEKKQMQQHSVVGYRILNLFDDTLDLAEGILNHHERWDGSGYPKGIKGQEIPILARIIAVAEYYDALTNERNPNAISKEEAIAEIKKQSGLKFDPEIARIFVDMCQAR